MTAAIVLAAGAGRRLGGRNKALLPAMGDSALGAIAACARGSGVRDIVVVVGRPHLDETAAEAGRLGLATAVNPEPECGMGSSVAAGFVHALEHFAADVALLWPVDHFCVRPDTIVAVLARSSADRVVVPTSAGRGGHPPAIGRSLWSRLAAEAADGGARAVLRSEAGRVLRVEVEDTGVLRDVDLPGDLD